MRRLWAILRLRCPRCFEGRLFRGLFTMYPECGSCGLPFEREPGYYLGAMYFSYGFGVLAVAPVTWYLIEIDVSLRTIALVCAAELTLLSPLMFRYARALWLHFDQLVNPR